MFPFAVSWPWEKRQESSKMLVLHLVPKTLIHVEGGSNPRLFAKAGLLRPTPIAGSSEGEVRTIFRVTFHPCLTSYGCLENILCGRTSPKFASRQVTELTGKKFWNCPTG